MTAAKTCDHFEQGWGVCGAPTEHRYLVGWRCPLHTPAALNGRPEPGATAYSIKRTAPGSTRATGPRRYPDDVCVPCVHCRKPVAPVNRELYGADEHAWCGPLPRRPGRLVYRDPELAAEIAARAIP